MISRGGRGLAAALGVALGLAGCAASSGERERRLESLEQAVRDLGAKQARLEEENANLTALLGNPWKQGHKGSIRPAGIQKVTETGVYRKRKRARRVAVLKNGIGDGDRISLCLYGWMVNRDHECWKSWRILCLMPVGGRSLSASRRSKVTAQGSCPSPLALACLSISWA